jgi:uncharacterized DUF497 family protein
MRFTWDPRKNERNIAKHGIDFTGAVRMFDGPTLVLRDDRKDYGEIRWIGFGMMGARVIAAVWTNRGDARRMISARKANSREAANYEARFTPAG